MNILETFDEVANDRVVFLYGSCKRNYTSGTKVTIHRQDITFTSSAPSGFSCAVIVPISESNSQMWYQLNVSSWGAGIVVTPTYTMNNVTIDVFGIFVKNTKFH